MGADAALGSASLRDKLRELDQGVTSFAISLLMDDLAQALRGPAERARLYLEGRCRTT